MHMNIYCTCCKEPVANAFSPPTSPLLMLSQVLELIAEADLSSCSPVIVDTQNSSLIPAI